MNLRRRKVYATLAFTGLVACASALVTLRLGRPLYYSDGQASLSGMELRYSTMLEWAAPKAEVELPGPVRGRVARLPDGRLLYGLANGERRTDLVLFDPKKPGLAPEPVLGLNTPGHELAPAVTEIEGTSATVFFASDRKGGAGGFDLYRARYRSGVFYSVQALPLTINSREDETDPAPHPDGEQLVFVRRNPHRFDGRNGTLMSARLVGAVDARPVFDDPNVSKSIEAPLDRDPAFTADGIGLWFVRQRVGEPTSVVRTFLHRDHYVEPLPVRALAEGGPFRAPVPDGDNASLWLLQPGKSAPGQGPTIARLMRSEAYEVYPWWEGQRWLERLLLTLMLFFALLTLLLTLGGRWQQLDLITKLLLLSMLLHLLLMLWFSRLEIVRRFRPEPPREGRIEVQLLSGRSESGSTADGAVAQQNFDVSRDLTFREREQALAAAAPGSELEGSAPELSGPDTTQRQELAASQAAPVADARDAARDVATRDARAMAAQLMARQVSTTENTNAKLVPQRREGDVESFRVTVPDSQFANTAAANGTTSPLPEASERSQPAASVAPAQPASVSDPIADTSRYSGRSSEAKLDARTKAVANTQIAPQARPTERSEASVRAEPTTTSTLAASAGRAPAATPELATPRAAPRETTRPDISAEVGDRVADAAAAPAVRASTAKASALAASELPTAVQKTAGGDTTARSERGSGSLQATGPKPMLARANPTALPASARELPSRDAASPAAAPVIDQLHDSAASSASRSTIAKAAPLSSAKVETVVRTGAVVEAGQRTESSQATELVTKGPDSMLARTNAATVAATPRPAPNPSAMTAVAPLVDRVDVSDIASAAKSRSGTASAAADHAVELDTVGAPVAEASTAKRATPNGGEQRAIPVPTTMLSGKSEPVRTPTTDRPNAWTRKLAGDELAMAKLSDSLDSTGAATADAARVGAAKASGDHAASIEAIDAPATNATSAKRTTAVAGGEQQAVPVPTTMLAGAGESVRTPGTERANEWKREPVDHELGVAVADGLSDAPSIEATDPARRVDPGGIAAAPLAAVAGPIASSFEPDATRRLPRGDRTPPFGIRPPRSFLERAGGGAPMRETVASRPENVYQNRFGAEKVAALKRFGGTEETERAVARGLEYLARVQTRDGSWGDKSRTQDKYGDVFVGKTGLCLLAFLGAGHTHKSQTQHSKVARKAIDFLLFAQDADTGHFGLTSSYSHGITTYALAECYALTKDPDLKRPLEDAVKWILENQNLTRDQRNRGGWGYFSPTLRPEDRYARASTSSWQVMALESAKIGGLEVPDRSMQLAREFFKQLFDKRGGYFLYTREPSRLRMDWRTLPASTPASIFCLLLLGGDADDSRIESALEWTLERKPRAFRRYSEDAFVKQAAGHTYFWYYASLACFLAGGETWDEWNAQLKKVLPSAQERDGSWRPIDPYAEYAGDTNRDRSYTTAMCVLSLEVYYRYFTPLLKDR